VVNFKNKIIGDEPCPQCRSMGRDSTGNHLMVFDDGGRYCNRCGYHRAGEQIENEEELIMSPKTIEEVLSLPSPMQHRGIEAETFERYQCKASYSTTHAGQMEEIYFPVFDLTGDLIGYKGVKLDDKKFFAVGEIKSKHGEKLFGQQTCGNSSKYLVITEGEFDAMSAAQMLHKSKYFTTYWPNVVSLTHGAGSAVSCIRDNLEWVSGHSDIRLAFDNDAPGKEQISKVSSLIGSGVKVVML
jgi:hypothetical protein